MKKSRGFTIVEIAVVITIIALLVTAVTVMFIPVQKQSRDKRRASDMTVFLASLEKYYDTYGEYPTDDTLAAKITAGQVSGLITQSARSTPPIIGSATTEASLKSQVAPNTDSNFGDPLRATVDGIFSSTQLTATTGADFRYLYIGGGDHTGAGTVTGFTVNFILPNNTTVPCTYSYTTTTSGAGSYIAGYFSESTNAFVLYKGRQGNAINWNTGSNASCPTPLTGN